MNKKIIIFIIIIAVVLSGCQLAVEGADNSMEPDKHDKLVGFFLTEEYIDLFDFDAFASDNINALSKGETTAAGTQYEGRAYGTINPDDPNDVVFGDYEGVVFMYISYKKDGETYSSVGSSNQIAGVHIYINNEGKRVEGEVYVNSSGPIINAVMNPIYKTPEGEIYFISGSGISMQNDHDGSMSQSMSEEHTVREGSEETTESFTVEVTVECAIDAEYYVFKQLDKDDNVVSAIKIYSDDIPDSIELSDETEYIILEKVGVNYQGKKVSERTIINDETYFSIYFFNDSIFAEHFSVQLERD